MNITYEKFDDYYIFSSNPKQRVYLGTATTEDYIHDVAEQAKRSASCHYVHKETGAEVSSKNDLDPYDIIDNYEYECSYEFKNKLHMGSMSGLKKSCTYNSEDPAMERLANAYFFNQTLEQYDARQEEHRLKREKSKRENPELHNLMWVDGRMYYVDDDGKEISNEEHFKKMRAELGDDYFDKELK